MKSLKELKKLLLLSMLKSEERKLLKLTEQNNAMLKEIIAYINYINGHASSENDADFSRNILANVISTSIFRDR